MNRKENRNGGYREQLLPLGLRQDQICKQLPLAHPQSWESDLLGKDTTERGAAHKPSRILPIEAVTEFIGNPRTGCLQTLLGAYRFWRGILPGLLLYLTGKRPPGCLPDSLETTCKGAAETCWDGPPRHPACCWPLGTSGASWQGPTRQSSHSLLHYSSSTLTKLSLMSSGKGKTIPGPAPGS